MDRVKEEKFKAWLSRPTKGENGDGSKKARKGGRGAKRRRMCLHFCFASVICLKRGMLNS